MTDEELITPMAAKKQKKVFFNWTPERNLTFAKICNSKYVHLTTTNMTKDQKWQSVLIALKAKPEFDELEVSWKSLSERFRTEQALILDRYGMTKDSVNLSGLPEKPPEYEDILINMAVSSKAANDKAKRQRESKSQKKRFMNSLESTELAKQGRSSSPFTDISTYSSQQGTSSAVSGSTTRVYTGSLVSPPTSMANFSKV